MKFSWQVPQFKQLSLSSAIIFLIVEIQDQTWLFDAYIKGEKLQAMNNFIVLPDICQQYIMESNSSSMRNAAWNNQVRRDFQTTSQPLMNRSHNLDTLTSVI